MATTAGWYIGRITSSSVATAKAGTSPVITDTVFHWTNTTTKPTVTTANITGLSAIVGGPYATQAAATAAANGDASTTSGLPGTTKPAVTSSTVNSSNGSLPNLLSWESGLATFLSDLTSSSTWIRVAEVVIGGVLLIVGLAHITGATQVISKIPPVLPV
jgi:hypothetical protein